MDKKELFNALGEFFSEILDQADKAPPREEEAADDPVRGEPALAPAQASAPVAFEPANPVDTYTFSQEEVERLVLARDHLVSVLGTDQPGLIDVAEPAPPATVPTPAPPAGSYARLEADLQAMLDAAGVSFFTAAELLTLGGGHYMREHPGFGLNEHPTSAELANIVDTAVVADLARRELKSPVFVNSGHRSDAYNASLPGSAPNSTHLTFHALDLSPADPKLVPALYRICRRLRNERVWTGGLGGYKTFVHIDTGTGTNRNWGTEY